MDPLVERYKRQATLLEARDEEIAWCELNNRPWKLVNGLIAGSGDPTALAGGFAGVEITPAPVNQSLVTGGATELLLWPGASATPIAANPQIPKVYELHAWGTSTTAATQGTFTLNPRVGTTITSPSIGVSAAITPVSTALGAPWSIKGKLLVRTGGTAAVATGSFQFRQSSTAAATPGPVSATSNCELGGISATFDATVAAALVFGIIATTSTTNTYTPQAVVWGSWN